MYIERAADRDDRTSHWLVCDAADKVLKFCCSESEAKTWIHTQVALQHYRAGVRAQKAARRDNG